MDRSIAMLIGLAATIALLGLWALKRRLSSTKRKKASGSGLALALLFLSSGRMPPPPPQSQIEQGVGERKNRLVGRKDD